MKHIGILLLLILSHHLASAQTWSISAKSGEIAFGATVYIESVYPKPGAAKGLTDTLVATGMLLRDSNKVYLVTTKHSVQRNLLGKNEQLLNTNITLTTAAINTVKVKGVKLPRLSGKGSPCVLSSDADDIAIISFQKNEYRAVLAALKKEEGRPLPVDSLDVSGDRYPDEDYFHPSYMVYKSKTGARTWSKGLGTAKIKTYDEKSPVFTVSDYIGAGNNGSPLFIDDKIIGMVTHGENMGPNAETIREPFKKSRTGIVVKSSLIRILFKKMQQLENAPDFNGAGMVMKPQQSRR